jgi:hypothetical protein
MEFFELSARQKIFFIFKKKTFFFFVEIVLKKAFFMEDQTVPSIFLNKRNLCKRTKSAIFVKILIDNEKILIKSPQKKKSRAGKNACLGWGTVLPWKMP